MARILIIDDEKDLCHVLGHFLTRHGHQVSEAHKGKRALEIIHEKMPDLILCDFKLEDMDGATMLRAIKEINPGLPVIIITGFGNIKTAVEVMRLGAVDYMIKPLIPDEILLSINKALKKTEMSADVPSGDARQNDNDDRDKNNGSEKNGKRASKTPDYVFFGDSPTFKNILRQIDLVAPTNYSVIIYGESGSGKEAIAQEIHKRSKRSHKPFVAIDCGCLSKELAGSELFGHEKGAFTGAINQKIGSFEIANEGTIFLDEIANLPYDVQVSLLRVIQERKMRRVGGVKDVDLDVRIIVASNEKLWDYSGNSKLREDLYHRFNEFVINVPPLHERPEDLMTFANHFLLQANEELNKDLKGFHPDVERVFKNYVWHGNLRELRNVVKRATLLCDEDYIDVKCLPFELVNFSKLQFDGQRDDAAAHEKSPDMGSFQYSSPFREDTTVERSLKSAGIDAEYKLILEALKKVNFNKSRAAKVLKIDRKTLYNKIKQYHELRGESAAKSGI